MPEIFTFIMIMSALAVGGFLGRHLAGRRLAAACRDAVRGDEWNSAGLPEPLAGLVLDFQTRFEAVRREHVLARRVATERADRASRVMQGLEDPVLIIEPGGEVREFNHAAGALTGVKAETGVNSVECLLPCRVAAREIEDLARGLSETELGVVRRTNFTFTDQDDARTIRDFTVTMRRLDEADRVLVVIHETTREREIARIKSEFVAKASHELRTPLSSIRATLEMLEEGDLDELETRTEMLGIATEETGRLGRLVEDMLDISRIEAGVARPRIESVNLGEVAAEVLDGLRAAADRKSLDLSLRVRDEGLVVEGDREMLATVIGNLAGNAVKYVPDGERVVVEIAPDDLTRSVVVTVTDTGLGIPPEDVPRIFEKFYRVARYERRARGSGLGLDLCRNIVEEVHQGRIGVDSTIGEGARFWFGVPAKHASTLAA